jgi:hypothetical protein
MAPGADWCNAARALMFAPGCVKSKNCYTARFPTGVTTQNRQRQRVLVVEEKYLRVANYHRNTMLRLGDLIGAAGIDNPSQLRPHHLQHRVSPNEVVTMDRIAEFLQEGQLLEVPGSTRYAEWWEAATPSSFRPRAFAGPGADQCSHLM